MATSADLDIRVSSRLDEAGADSVLALADAAASTDTTAPLSEQVLMRLRAEGLDPRHHVLVTAGPQRRLVGYAQVAPGSGGEPATGEVVVHPSHRRRGIGTRLVAAAESQAPQGVLVWAHGATPPARGLARALGYVAVRELLMLELPLTSPGPAPRDLPAPVLPPGVSVRTWRPADAAAVTALNALAFDGHPEQGRMSEADLAARMAQPWFDPAGLFLATGPDGDLVAFHWTKVHGHGVGEVYVVGVHPAWQGRGLGRAMTLVGLHHLRGLVATAVLYVEADNEAAVRTYESLGFRRKAADVQFARAGSPATARRAAAAG